MHGMIPRLDVVAFAIRIVLKDDGATERAEVLFGQVGVD